MTTLPQTIEHRPGSPNAGSANGSGNGAPNGYANGYGAGYANGYSAGPPVSTLPAVSPPPGAAGAGGSGVQMTGSDIVRVLRENWWLIALAAVVSAAIGYVLNQYLAKHYLTYTADATVAVSTPKIFNPEGKLIADRGRLQEDELDIRMQTQAFGLKNDELLEQILQDPNSQLQQSEWLRREAGITRPDGSQSLDIDLAKEALLEAYSVSPRQGTQLITVSFSADDRTEATRILQELVSFRIEQLKRRTRGEKTRDLELMTVMKTEREREIEKIDNEILRLRAAMEGEQATTVGVLHDEVRLINTRLIDQRSNLLFAEQQLETFEDSLARGVTPPEVEAFVRSDPSVAQLRQRKTGLDLDIETQRRRYGARSETIRMLEDQRDSIDQQLRSRENELRDAEAKRLRSGLAAQLDAIKRSVADAEASLAANQTKLSALQQDESDLQRLERQREDRREELSNFQATLDATLRATNVQEQNNEVELQWAEQPTRPTSPSFPRLPLTMAACTLLGVGLAVGFAFLREVLDTSVKSPRDILRAGGLDVLGAIPDESDDPEAATGNNPLELTIANAPHSMTAEQFRTVRSRLAQVTPLESTRTILITSPQPGDGKTTVACNLAAGMALNGRRVLLVDANFRRPRLHEVFKVDNGVGLSGCLGDADRFDEAVFEAEGVPNLHVLPAGPRPENSTELVEGVNFTDVLDRALEQYDLVLFDSGPILFASETGAIAPQVDGVVTVVRARKSSRGLIGRLRDSLRSLNVEHLGVVLNAVRGRAGGYYNRNMKTYYKYQTAGRR